MSFKQGHKLGASKSLTLTITEIMDFLEHEERPKGKLRPALREKIGDLAVHWFKRGFNRGHIESHKHFMEDGIVPELLEFECNRTVSPHQDRELQLKSKIKKKTNKKSVIKRVK